MTKINKHFKYVKKKIDKIVLYYENRFSNVKHIVFLLNGSVKLNKKFTPPTFGWFVYAQKSILWAASPTSSNFFTLVKS